MPRQRKPLVPNRRPGRKTAPPSVEATLTPTECAALQIIYAADFYTAEFFKDYYPNGKRVPASRWRWMTCQAARDADFGSILFKVADEHQWSKAELEAHYPALRARELIEIESENDPTLFSVDSAKPQQPRVFIRLTPLGRRVSRARWGQRPGRDTHTQRRARAGRAR